MGRGASACPHHHWILERKDIVPSIDHFARHHHRQTDRAISDAFARLGAEARPRASFIALLDAARRRGRRLLAAPLIDGRHPGVEALLQLARAADAHLRPAAGWNGSAASWRRAVHELASHLLGAYA